MRLHRHAEARAILLAVLDSHGPDVAILCNLANATACVGRQEEAVAIVRRAIGLDPAAMLPRRALCNTLPYRDATTGAELLAAMRDCSAVLPRVGQPPLGNTRDPDRKLVVGLLSGTLRSHPVGWLTVAGIETLDPEQFSVVCLVQNAAPEDPMARRYHAAAHAWIEVDGLSDAALTAVAREQGIDILIDLGGYGDAAPHAGLRQPVGTGADQMGRHAGAQLRPGRDGLVSHRPVGNAGRLRAALQREAAAAAGRICLLQPAAACARRGGVAGADQRVRHVRLLQQPGQDHAAGDRDLGGDPAAHSRRSADPEDAQLSDRPTADGLLADFASLGVDGGRIELRGSSGHRAFMGEYGDVDIVLDPFPYSGGLTTCEALWMGVPTITLPGEIFASRHSASHMSNAGLPDWVVGSVEGYIDMAVARAADLAALAELRTGLRDRVRRSPLCDAPRFGRGLGAALRHAWRAWCADGSLLL